MRVRTTVAAGMLAAVVSFPLAGVALADGEDCPYSGAPAAPGAGLITEAGSPAPGVQNAACDLVADVLGGDLMKGDLLEGGSLGDLAEGGSLGGDLIDQAGAGAHEIGKQVGDEHREKAEGADGADACASDSAEVCMPDKAGTPAAEQHRTDVHVPADGDIDSGPAPVGGVEAGAGGTAGGAGAALMPLSLAGGAALAGVGVAVAAWRRLTGRAG